MCVNFQVVHQFLRKYTSIYNFKLMKKLYFISYQAKFKILGLFKPCFSFVQVGHVIFNMARFKISYKI